MSRREIAKSGARIALGVVALTALVALLQVVSCNRANAAGEGSWIMPCWVYEEEAVVVGTVPFPLSGGRVIQVPQYEIKHHWHPLAVAGWSLPPAVTLIGFAVAIRRRNRRPLRVGAIVALSVLAAGYFISPLVAWDIGPPRPGIPSPGELGRGGETLAHDPLTIPVTPAAPDDPER